MRGNFEARGERSLVGTFPFNTNVGAHHHEDLRAAHQVEDNRISSQGGYDTDVSFGAVAGAAPGPDGKKYIDKGETSPHCFQCWALWDL